VCLAPGCALFFFLLSFFPFLCLWSVCLPGWLLLGLLASRLFLVRLRVFLVAGILSLRSFSHDLSSVMSSFLLLLASLFLLAHFVPLLSLSGLPCWFPSVFRLVPFCLYPCSLSSSFLFPSVRLYFLLPFKSSCLFLSPGRCVVILACQMCPLGCLCLVFSISPFLSHPINSHPDSKFSLASSRHDSCSRQQWHAHRWS
jgi:hypothetical protein